MVEAINFGIRDYGETLQLQEKLFEELINSKKSCDAEKEYILIGEHPSVITMGRRAKEENVLVSESLLKSKGINLYHIGRGGDVTYHCPGQMIVYPIIDLDKHGLGVKDYVAILEESVIRLLEKYGIKGERVEGATGVWIGKGTSKERKICAIGIKCNRFCTMHGLALNVTSDLSGFSMINPCGFQDKGVTSLELEIQGIGEKALGLMDKMRDREFMEKVKRDFLHIFFGLVFPLEEVLNFSE